MSKSDQLRLRAALLGVAELAELLGVSRQRASELATQSNFPSPVAQLTATPVWDKATIGNFLKEWKRTPGRPSTKHTDLADATIIDLP